MSATSTTARPADPGVLDALSLLAEVADELVVRTVRDTHVAWTDRVHGIAPQGHRRDRCLGRRGAAPRHRRSGVRRPRRRPARSLSRARRGGLHGGRAAARGRPAWTVPQLRGQRPDRRPPRAGATPAGDPDVGARGRPRRGARPRRPRRGVPRCRPGGSWCFLHGLCENEESWDLHRDEVGTTYGESLAAQGWTPVFLRANTGLSLRENGVALTALLQRLVEEWPGEVDPHRAGRALDGRAGDARRRAPSRPRPRCPGPGSSPTSSRSAPRTSARRWRRTSVTAAGRSPGCPRPRRSARILDWRSVGVHDLVAGLAEDVPALPHARYRLVVAPRSPTRPRHPVGAFLGDLLVRAPSAYGRERGRADLFPGAETLHVPKADHFDLLNHPARARRAASLAGLRRSAVRRGRRRRGSPGRRCWRSRRGSRPGRRAAPGRLRRWPARAAGASRAWRPRRP